jgi:phosphomannomutase
MKKTHVEAKTKQSDNLKRIILFDMDGTLTPPREEMESFMVKKIRQLSAYCRIGIVSGSDFDYIIQQCAVMFEPGGVEVGKVDILPCNGTKLYRWKNGQHQLDYNVDMIKKIGAMSYRRILAKIFDYQADISKFYPEIPFTGTFFQYRGSMLNWCPIGRSADSTQRKDWKKWDKNYHIRKIYMKELQEFISKSGITVTIALGGSTSFDIYPCGWDKTYALGHYEDYEVFFVGDKCKRDGNDWHIYERLKGIGKSFATTGPLETTKIIDKIIEKL